MAINPWLRENMEDEPEVQIVISTHYKDENGNPRPWTFKKLTSLETDKLQQACMIKNFDPKTGQTTRELDALKYLNALAARSIIDPDFKDPELQKSFGTQGSEVDTMSSMLYPKEKDKLAEEINKLYRLNEDLLLEKAEEAKNE